MIPAALRFDLRCAPFATVTEPDRVPTAAGVKVTLMVQLAPGARELPQVFVSAKSPVIVIPEIVSGAFPVFESVVLWMGLVVPTS